VAEEYRANFRCAERKSEVSRGAFMNGIHGETTGFVGGFGEN
jgi:hypothetical protein